MVTGLEIEGMASCTLPDAGTLMWMRNYVRNDNVVSLPSVDAPSSSVLDSSKVMSRVMMIFFDVGL
jgi:hypothetical protein